MTGSNKFWSIIYSIVLILQTFYWLQPHEVEDRLFFNVVYFHFSLSLVLLVFYLIDNKECEKFLYGSPEPMLYKQLRLANVAIFFIGIVFLIKVGKKLNNILNDWSDERLG